MSLVRILALAASAAAVAAGQDFVQRGFIETQALVYPQTAPNDSGHVVAESLLRYELSRTLLPGLRFNGGIDARTDTHQQTERSLRLDTRDRSIRRPSISLRRVSLSYSKHGITIEAGKQFVRWGKTDILTPTDRFAPRDYMSVVRNDFLPITAARVTLERGSTSLDVVWQPLFTPSRIPLIAQRWVVLPPVPVQDIGARYPGGSAYGARLNHVGRVYEASVSFYDGHHHLPLLAALPSNDFSRVFVQRFYPHVRTYGGDLAIPTRWLTFKGEAAYVLSRHAQADEYVLYVVQLERQIGELALVGGYAGEKVTKRRNPFDFAPDRGLADAFLARADYTIDPNRSVAFETAVRRNGDGIWVRAEYSQAFGRHWRITGGTGIVRGNREDFLGQYRRNSHATLVIRYSF